MQEKNTCRFADEFPQSELLRSLKYKFVEVELKNQFVY